MLDFILTHTPLFYLIQSLWRDEGFSVWIAKDSLLNVITRTSGDFNPPLYYLILNLWMHTFGNSEIVLRSLSLIFHLLLVWVVFRFAQAVFKQRSYAITTALLAATNPMLVYFAFELRMYSLLALLATASMYFLYTKQWKKYVIAAALGLYTQPFMAFVLIAQGIYLFLTKQVIQAIFGLSAIGLLYLPWIPVLLTQFSHSGAMWMYPINGTLVSAVLGNLYLGYEGTPGILWPLMQLLTVLFSIAALLVWRKKALRKQALLFFCWIFIPLCIVLSISLFKPIYVHRYVIFVTVGELFLVTFALTLIHDSRLRMNITIVLIGATILFNFYAPAMHRKLPIRETFTKVIPLLAPTDVVVAQTPLVYYETLYYTPVTNRVFLYNPQRQEPPRYVGSGGMPEETWMSQFPTAPLRAFLIKENGEYEIISGKKL
jgi:uncharacterized membrane protein